MAKMTQEEQAFWDDAAAHALGGLLALSVRSSDASVIAAAAAYGADALLSERTKRAQGHNDDPNNPIPAPTDPEPEPQPVAMHAAPEHEQHKDHGAHGVFSKGKRH